MQVWGQPGEYVRLKGVDVHAYTNRPTSANPAINCHQCNYLGAMIQIYQKFANIVFKTEVIYEL